MPETEQRGHNPKDGLEEQHAVLCEISERAIRQIQVTAGE